MFRRKTITQEDFSRTKKNWENKDKERKFTAQRKKTKKLKNI